MGYAVAMRLHITLDDALVATLDRRVGARGRSRYIAAAVARALEDDWRWEQIESALGSVEDGGHEWDEDPGAWVRAQRASDPRRVG